MSSTGVPASALLVIALIAAWAPAQPDDVALAHLLEQLASSDFATRERATEGFLARGSNARAFLERARSGLDLEGRLRIDAILARLAGSEDAGGPREFEATLVDIDLREVPIGDAARRLARRRHASGHCGGE